MAYKKKSDYVSVLNVIQALGADASLSGGKLDITGLPTIVTKDAVSYVKKAYAAGTASVKTVDFTGSILQAGGIYRLAVEVPGAVDFPSTSATSSSQEANDLSKIRSYEYGTGNTVPTAADIATALEAEINADPHARVSVSRAGAVLTLTLLDVNDGDFQPSVSGLAVGATFGTTTPYVAPAGTPSIVDIEAGAGVSLAAGQYTTWEIVADQKVKSNGVNGNKVFREVVCILFAEVNATNYAALETAVDDILDGTHTPASDYLGI